MPKPKLLVADDTPDILHLLGILLGPDFEIVAEATDGAEALAAYSDHRHELFALVLDHHMPHMTGLDVARRVLSEDPDARVLLFTADASHSLCAQAAEIGVEVVPKGELLSLPEHPVLSRPA